MEGDEKIVEAFALRADILTEIAVKASTRNQMGVDKSRLYTDLYPTIFHLVVLGRLK